jgi:hypothetical protein
VLKHYKTACSRHGIRRDVVEAIALAKIQEVVKYARENKTIFSERVQAMSQRESDEAIKTKIKELTKAERRTNELDNIIKRLYEDNISGKLNDTLFAKFLHDYESEHSGLAEKMVLLKAGIEELQGKMADVQSFLSLAENHGEVVELTADVARRFIDRIVVHEVSIEEDTTEKTARGTFRQRRIQEVQVFINCIGEFSPE